MWRRFEKIFYVVIVFIQFFFSYYKLVWNSQKKYKLIGSKNKIPLYSIKIIHKKNLPYFLLPEKKQQNFPLSNRQTVTFSKKNHIHSTINNKPYITKLFATNKKKINIQIFYSQHKNHNELILYLKFPRTKIFPGQRI